MEDKDIPEELTDSPEVPQEAEGLVGKADAAAQRLEDANKEFSKLLDRQEQLKVESTLGGTASAGSPSLSKEEKEIQDAREMLKGTGMEDLAFPPDVK